MNEIEQVACAKAGDEAAWGALVRQHQEALFRLAYLLLKDADDAADVTQESFLRAYRALGQFDSTRPLRPWLLEITRNQCYNWSRTLRRRWAALQRWREATPSAKVDIHTETSQQWQANMLWQAVQRLPRADQEVIYLRYFLELPVEETALVLQVAPGTIKSRLSRALNRLRRVVEQEFPGLREEVNE